jgi:hypothetical protein
LVHVFRDLKCAEKEDVATHSLQVGCNDIGNYTCHASLDSSEDYELDGLERSVYLNFTGKDMRQASNNKILHRVILK